MLRKQLQWVSDPWQWAATVGPYVARPIRPGGWGGASAFLASRKLNDAFQKCIDFDSAGEHRGGLVQCQIQGRQEVRPR